MNQELFNSNFLTFAAWNRGDKVMVEYLNEPTVIHFGWVSGFAHNSTDQLVLEVELVGRAWRGEPALHTVLLFPADTATHKITRIQGDR